MTAEQLARDLDRTLAGRPWIIATNVLAGATALVDRLHGLNCAVFVVAGTVGTGPLPSPDKCEQFLLGIQGSTMMAAIRAFGAAIERPPTELCNRLDAWDPAGEAMVLANFLNQPHPLCGRRVFGARPRQWLELEDKIVADSLWESIGLPKPPSRVVPATDRAAIFAAVEAVQAEDGAVIAGDNREGWHGGAEYTRYVRPGSDCEDTLSFFADHCDMVRVTPFLRGVPCSIHGMVFPDQVLAFRPVEMLVFRKPGQDRFFYSALATTWDPPEGAREQMRATVRRVGTELRSMVDYRGAFGIDGVLTADGFLPTELNSRFSSGLQAQAKAFDFPLEDVHRLLIAGHSVPADPKELESWIVEAADRERMARCLTPITHFQVDTTTELSVSWTDERWQVVDADNRDGLLRLGPAAEGSLVMFSLEPGHGIAAGPSFADKAAAVFTLTDELWDTRVGPLIPGAAAVA